MAGALLAGEQFSVHEFNFSSFLNFYSPFFCIWPESGGKDATKECLHAKLANEMS